MENHEKYAALLDAFIDGELSEQEAEEVRGHLTLCADCQAYVADALAMRDAFPDIEETVVPDGFAESVIAALPPRRITWRKQWAKIALSLAACAAIVLLIRGLPGDRLAGRGGASGSGMEKAVLFDMDAGGGTPGAALPADDADTMPPESSEAIQEYDISMAGASESGSAPEQRSAATVSLEDAEAERVYDTGTTSDTGAASSQTAGTQTGSGAGTTAAGTQTSSDTGAASSQNAGTQTGSGAGTASGGTQTSSDTGAASGKTAGTQISSGTGTTSDENAERQTDFNAGTASNETAGTQTSSDAGTASNKNTETVSNGDAASGAASVTQTPETLPDETPAPEPVTKAVPTEEPPDAETPPVEDTVTEFAPGEDTVFPLEEYTETEFPPEEDAATEFLPAENAVTEVAPEEDTLMGFVGAETVEEELSHVWTIPVEAISLLDGYTSAGETESGIWYALTPEEFGELFQSLADMDMEAVTGAGETPPITFPGVEYVFVPL